MAANPDLEATLCESIDDPARWAVYADWLQEHGDVRGEIIALGLADRTAEAKALLEAHAEALWGSAWKLREGTAFEGLTWLPGWNDAAPQPIEATFEHALDPLGLVESITMHGLDEQGYVATALYDVLASPIGRFVRSIELSPTVDQTYSGASGHVNYGAVVDAIARARPRALRRLAITDGGYQTSWTETGELGPLLATTPHLESLTINIGSIDLGESLDLPRLHTLHLETGGLARANVLAIAAATWPALTDLTVFFGQQSYGGDTTPEDIAALVANPFPRVAKLALCNAEVPGAIAAAIAASPLLARLTSLDLSKSTMTDDDARPIVENLARFAHLERFDLSENYLSPDTEELLAARSIDTSDQKYEQMVSDRAQYGHEEWAKDSTFRYTTLGE